MRCARAEVYIQKNTHAGGAAPRENHGDDLMDPALVWSTAQTQLPTLLRDVQALLAQRP